MLINVSENARRCGIIAIFGRPNAGKSTLLNHILGEKLTAVSPKAQTTRRRFRGIYTNENVQMIFVDTPGLHVAPTGKKLNEFCVFEALDTWRDSDILCYLVDNHRQWEGDRVGSDEWFILEELKKFFLQIQQKNKNPPSLIVAFTKTDLWEQDQNKMVNSVKIRESLSQKIPVNMFCSISSNNGRGVQNLLQAFKQELPEGNFLFPEDDLSDIDMRSIAADLIQEQLFLQLGEEIPYSCAVEIEKFSEPKGDKRLTEIEAAIHVERKSQKPMVIGKSGKKIKEIGQSARASIEKIIGNKIVLRLFVKHTPDWTRNLEDLKRLGYKRHE